ncbi:hypothetical protein GCM10007063_14280 [Lentibacillus kapialis]|uniref:Uncharacterized protein n=1 Tax=Lentibacillus kapialis TaxID=340214 RepID=A0A917PUS6_9BACI|nr:hypothetical protein [Lentibacillus kapialis]GGJ92843.1 hypothetical protein GCM10007063_14280 [Lentibacillus kapialis]
MKKSKEEACGKENAALPRLIAAEGRFFCGVFTLRIPTGVSVFFLR